MEKVNIYAFDKVIKDTNFNYKPNINFSSCFNDELKVGDVHSEYNILKKIDEDYQLQKEVDTIKEKYSKNCFSLQQNNEVIKDMTLDEAYEYFIQNASEDKIKRLEEYSKLFDEFEAKLANIEIGPLDNFYIHIPSILYYQVDVCKRGEQYVELNYGHSACFSDSDKELMDDLQKENEFLKKKINYLIDHDVKVLTNGFVVDNTYIEDLDEYLEKEFEKEKEERSNV